MQLVSFHYTIAARDEKDSSPMYTVVVLVMHKTHKMLVRKQRFSILRRCTCCRPSILVHSDRVIYFVSFSASFLA